MRQGELHHVGERALLQLVAVQGQELLELTSHIAVLKEGKKENSVDLFKEYLMSFIKSHILKETGYLQVFDGCSFFFYVFASPEKQIFIVTKIIIYKMIYKEF